MDYIKTLLENRAPLLPKHTGVEPECLPFPAGTIRAVIFDIYGTMLISGSGDVDHVFLSASHLQEACNQCQLSLKTHPDFFVMLPEIYRKVVENELALRRCKGIEHPEIDITELWPKMIAVLYQEKLLEDIPSQETVEALALIFELCANPVWPMPGFQEILHHFESHGIKTGIVSNAQFYTPMILKYFFGIPYNSPLPYFTSSLCVYSYRTGFGKPAAEIFRHLAPGLNANNLVPHQCLFVGNDMLKDIFSAAAFGMHTALFAGDSRSLRLRANLPQIQALKPDCVITELLQLKDIVK